MTVRQRARAMLSIVVDIDSKRMAANDAVVQLSAKGDIRSETLRLRSALDALEDLVTAAHLRLDELEFAAGLCNEDGKRFDE